MASNIQAGAENRQAGVSVEGPTQSLVRPQARTIRQEQNQTRAETIQTYNAGIPAIYWIAWALSFCFAFWLDSPKRWPGQIYNALRRKT